MASRTLKPRSATVAATKRTPSRMTSITSAETAGGLRRCSAQAGSFARPSTHDQKELMCSSEALGLEYKQLIAAR
jgi:hypothetical protein